MSEGAANEARVVISTDYATMKEFVEFTQSKLDDIKNKGKGGFDAIGKAGTAMGGLIQGVFVGAGMELVNSFLGPLKHGFGEAMASAEKWRHTMTGVAVASGESIKKVGRDLDDLSRKTLRSGDELNAFIERVRQQTGDRKAAKAAAVGASREARARGYETVGEMADETVQLQQRWGVADIEKFYDKQRSGAKALGLNENLAAETFKRLQPTLGKTAMSAESAGRFSNSLLKATGGNMPMAVEAGSTLTGFVGGHLPYIEKTLQDAGLLKKGETLHDEYNRPDAGRALELMHKYQKGRRGQKGLDWVSMLHLPGPAGALFSKQMEAIGSAAEAQQYADPGTPLADTDKTFRGSEEGQNVAEDLRIAREGRKNAEGALGAQLGIKRKQKGHFLGWASGPLNWAMDQIGRPVDAAMDAMSSDKEVSAHGRQQFSAIREDWFGGGSYSGPGLGPMGPPAPAMTQDPKQLAAEQGKALGDSLQKGNALPVVIRGAVVVQTGPAPTTGQGGQY